MSKVLPSIDKVEARAGHVLRVKFRKGDWKSVNLKDLIVRHKRMAALRDPVVFRKARVIDWGAAVGWPGDLALGASTLWQIANESISLRPRNV